MEKILTELEAKDFLLKHGIKTTKQRLATSEDGAVIFANELGYPVVMKIVSPDIIHKTEANGVRVCVGSAEAVRHEYNSILESAKKYKRDAKIHGILVQEMAQGIEVIVGVSKDAQFGHTIMFGLGGVFVEVMKDVSFRVLPIAKKDAFALVKEIKGYKILAGIRGKKPANLNAIVDVLLKVSDILSKNQNIKELDINPLFVNEKEAKAADARIVFEQ